MLYAIRSQQALPSYMVLLLYIDGRLLGRSYDLVCVCCTPTEPAGAVLLSALPAPAYPITAGCWLLLSAVCWCLHKLR